jgi:hypothetical protein
MRNRQRFDAIAMGGAKDLDVMIPYDGHGMNKRRVAIATTGIKQRRMVAYNRAQVAINGLTKADPRVQLVVAAYDGADVVTPSLKCRRDAASLNSQFYAQLG